MFKRMIAGLLLLLAIVMPGTVPAHAQSSLPVERIVLPAGFSISLYTDQVPGARSLAIGSAGTVFVGTRNPSSVFAVRDDDGDGTADKVVAIAQNMRVPNGVAFHDRALYVATLTQILRYDDIENRLDDPPDPVVVLDGLPNEQHHGPRFLGISPENKMVVSIGVPCNVCEPEQDVFGIIVQLNLDGSGQEVIARGVRNSVGFDWHPTTGELWFTDNGRDWISDDLPPDELNRVTEPGQHFGFPYCHGGFLQDIDFDDRHACDEFSSPAINLGPHVAPLGMRFYTGSMFPDAYHGQIMIAEHGSWNRSEPIGARLTLVRLDENGDAASYEVFAAGWQNPDGTRWGRPVDVLVMPDGALLVSDDAAGALYRIAYAG